MLALRISSTAFAMLIARNPLWQGNFDDLPKLTANLLNEDVEHLMS